MREERSRPTAVMSVTGRRMHVGRSPASDSSSCQSVCLEIFKKISKFQKDMKVKQHQIRPSFHIEGTAGSHL